MGRNPSKRTERVSGEVEGVTCVNNGVALPLESVTVFVEERA